MTFLEKNLEDIMYEAMLDRDTWDKILCRGLWSNTPYMVRRQFKIGNYGTCDIITFSRRQVAFNPNENELVCLEPTVITIYELKQNIIGLDSLVQISRYMKGVNQWLIKKRKSLNNYKIQGVLIGRTINTNHDYVYLFEQIDKDDSDSHFGGINVYTYDYDMDGISFTHESLSNYCLTNEGF